MEHPADDVLRRFLRATTTREENRQVVTHLLARCPSCVAALRTIKREKPPPVAYDQALAQLAMRLRMRHEAPPAAQVSLFLTFRR